MGYGLHQQPHLRPQIKGLNILVIGKYYKLLPNRHQIIIIFRVELEQKVGII